MLVRSYKAAFILLFTLVLVLTGCAGKKDPKEALSSAAVQALSMESYVMDNQIKIVDLSYTSDDSSSYTAAQVGAVFSILKDAEINISGIYQQDPMQSELTLEIKLTGDMSTTIKVPMVVTEDKLYIKIPSIPFLPLPDTVVGKFLVMDMQEMIEQSGQEFNPEMFDPNKSKKLTGEITGAVFAEYDEATYFKNVDPKDAGLPEGISAKQVVQFSVTNDNVKPALEILIHKVTPKLLDIIEKEEYRSLIGVTPEQIEEARTGLQEENQSEIGAALDEMLEYLSVHELTLNTAIDKKDYPVYQDANIDLEFNDPSTKDTVRLALQFNSSFSKINEKQTFEIGIPTDTITMEQFEQEMGGLGY